MLSKEQISTTKKETLNKELRDSSSLRRRNRLTKMGGAHRHIKKDHLLMRLLGRNGGRHPVSWLLMEALAH